MSTDHPLETDWYDVDSGVVALLDALGTKGIWSTRPPTQVFEQWKKILNLIEHSARTNVQSLESYNRWLLNPEPDQLGCRHCDPIAFSDSLFIPMAPWEQKHLSIIMGMMGRLLAELVWTGLVTGTFLRGSVSIGQFYQARTKIVGPAVDEVASWYDLADWIGVTVAPTMARALDYQENFGIDVSEFYTKYKVPYKDRSRDHWVIDWPRFAHKTTKHPELALLGAFREHGGVVAPSVESKYTNTIAFFRDHDCRKPPSP